jgi:methylenetetrahydrofolate dehydrogenase (NADP+)/methenyltetrahydrofolate cyclohydrolase
MIVDGRAIAQRVLASVAEETTKLGFRPKLGVLTCAPGAETRQYLDLKQRKAQEVGIDLVVLELPASASTEDCITSVERLAPECHGVLVQLPLPTTIDRERVLEAVPVNQDPDGFAYGRDPASVLPPVVGAIDSISTAYKITFKEKKVVVLGNGRLVGKPSERYARAKGALVSVLTETTENYKEQLKTADILISGVGKPQFVTPDMVRPGLVVFDAGASEDGGVVVGDIHPDVAEQAELITPVPGGIGPITVAVLFANLLTLIKQG